MTTYCSFNLYLALAHHPVVNKRGEIIASAVTNLDIHDMARAVRTYGAKALYVVTPLEDQQQLAKSLVRHWTSGYGAEYNPKRRLALETVRVHDSLEQSCIDIAQETGCRPQTVVTSARRHANSISLARFQEILGIGTPCLLVFGTAWGLAPDCIATADHILEPISGHTDYNHLSVRSAASIILDRLCGRADKS